MNGMQRLADLLGEATCVRTGQAWKVLSSEGSIEPERVLALLALGEDVFDARPEEREVVMTGEERLVAVATAQAAVVLRLPRNSNVGLALGYARGLVRSLH
jgi:hypothetical protein